MKKHLSIVMGMLLLSSCTQHDMHYYRLNPDKLHEALQNCSGKTTATCQQLAATAVEMNRLAYELQTNPQGFGQRILSMQEKLAAQQQDLAQNPANKEVAQSINLLKQQLEQYMAIVKWLESPEG